MYAIPPISALEAHTTIQRKADSHSLEVGAHDSAFEREADAVADQVMRMPMSGAKAQGISGHSATSIQRKCSACDDEKIHRKASSISQKGNNPTVNSNVQAKINSTRGQGQSLDTSTRGFMEARFGRDFSDVKVHTGSYSKELNRGLQAKAFAIGSDIYFNQGQYQPNSDSGKHLLAHELTHVVQQNGGSSQIQKSGMAGNIIQRTPEEDLEFVGPIQPHNVCMTFDDGPHGTGTDTVLSALGNNHATFFITGRKVEDGGTNPVNEDPGEQYRLVKEMLRRGHQIANHSMTHRPLTPAQYDVADKEAVVQSFRDNETYWQDLFLSHQDKFSGFDFTRLPGAGRGYAEIVAAVTEDSSLPHISWDFEFCPHNECSWIDENTHNWQGIEGVKGSFPGLPGSNAIILLHDHHWVGKGDKLTAIVRKLVENGYRFGRLDKAGNCE